MVESGALIAVGVGYRGCYLNVFVEQPEVRGSSLQPGLAARGDPGPSIKAMGRGTGSSSGHPAVQDEVSRGAPCSRRPLPGQWDHPVGIGCPGREWMGVTRTCSGGSRLVFHPVPAESSEAVLWVPEEGLAFAFGTFPSKSALPLQG